MDDPLTHLTAALKELLQRQCRLDELEIEATDDQKRGQIARWRETNMQAISHVERAIAATPATHADHAVIQVMVAAKCIDRSTVESEEDELDEDLTTARLLLQSALPVLAQALGVDLVATRAAHYGLSSSDSPFFREHPAEPQSETPSSVTG